MIHSIFFIVLWIQGYVLTHATDGSQYIAIATNLLRGNGFSLRLEAPFIADTIRTPVYPWFLWASMKVFGTPYASLIPSVILATGIPLVGMQLMRVYTADKRKWLVAGLILSIDLNLWYYSCILGSEAVFLPLIASGIAASIQALEKRSWKWSLVAGALVGAAALARPIVQFVPLLFTLITLAAFVREKQARITGVKVATAFVSAYIIIVLPWLYRNASLFGSWDYSNVGWFNFYTRVAATAEAYSTGRSYDSMRIEYLQRLHDKGYVEASPVQEQDVHGYAYKEIFQKETVVAVKKYPREFLISQISAAITVISQDNTILVLRELGWVNVGYPSFSPIVTLLQQGPMVFLEKMFGLVATPWGYAMCMRFVWLLAFVLALISPIVLWKKSTGHRHVLFFSWFYMLGIVALSLNAAAQADGRYRSQFIFIEIPLAVLSAVTIVERQRSKGEKKILCQACGALFWTRLLGKRKQFSVWKCHSCGSLTVDPMPSEAERKAFYADSYFSGNAAGGGYASYNADKIATRPTYEKMLDLLEPHRKPQAKLLDIGAASGMFVKWASERGWEATGQDISPAATEMAKANNVIVENISLEQLPVSTYTAICLLDVIEHVDEPRLFLRKALKSLAPGGAMLINTPDAGSVLGRVLRQYWHAVCPPEHVVLFSKKALIQLVEQEGNVVTWVGRIPKVFRLSYVFATAARWLNSKALSHGELWLKKHPKADISLPLPMRDNIALIAYRRD